MKKQLIFLLLLCPFVFMGCSDNDASEFSVANTEWVAKITPREISVPEEYREDGYWVLSFTDNEMSMSIKHHGYIVRYEFNGRYRLEGKNKILGLNANGSVEHDLYLQENGTVIYFPYFGTNLVKQ